MLKSDTESRTGTTCTVAGIYRSDCADEERVTLALETNSRNAPAVGMPWAGTWRSPPEQDKFPRPARLLAAG
jgi:hypothetical protein